MFTQAIEAANDRQVVGQPCAQGTIKRHNPTTGREAHEA